jgi:cytochrome c biogenesis protein CcmG/thiol:disulfide interchange protein DsbE
MKTLATAVLSCMLSLAIPSVRADTAPEFTLNNANGEAVSLADYRGRPVLLHFWATWCPYCKKLQPGLVATRDSFHEQGLVLLGISFREDEGTQPQAVLQSRGMDFMTLIDGDDVASAYDVSGTPTTFFIDRQGELVGRTSKSDPADPIWRQAAEMISK